MALDVLTVEPLHQGPDINRIRLMTEPSKKPASPPNLLVPSSTKLTTIEAKRIDLCRGHTLSGTPATSSLGLSKENNSCSAIRA